MAEKLTASEFDLLRETMQEKFGLTAAEITPDTVLENLDLDSLALIELALALQKSFDVAIPTSEIAPSNTVGELADLLASVRAGAS
jgi:acyl carrier protein